MAHCLCPVPSPALLAPQDSGNTSALHMICLHSALPFVLSLGEAQSLLKKKMLTLSLGKTSFYDCCKRALPSLFPWTAFPQPGKPIPVQAQPQHNHRLSLSGSTDKEIGCLVFGCGQTKTEVLCGGRGNCCSNVSVPSAFRFCHLVQTSSGILLATCRRAMSTS